MIPARRFYSGVCIRPLAAGHLALGSAQRKVRQIEVDGMRRGTGEKDMEIDVAFAMW